MDEKSYSRSTPLVLYFRRDIPEFIQILEELGKTEVGEFKKMLMLCRNYQEFDHSKKWCAKPMRRGKCGDDRHEMANCEASQSLGWHCGNEHATGSRLCKEHKYQEERLAVQTNERVKRYQAVLTFNEGNSPYMKMNYSEAMKRTTDTAKDIRDTGTCTEMAMAVMENQGNRREGICMSPCSGDLYTTTVNLGEEARGRAKKRKEPARRMLTLEKQ